MTRVAIAEEHTIMRWALHRALAQVPDLEIVGDAGTVQETLALIRRTKPDVLLLDLTLPDHTAYDVLAEIRELDEGPWVVVLASPETQKVFSNEGAEVVQKTGAEFGAFIAAELAKWQRVVKEAKIKAE